MLTAEERNSDRRVLRLGLTARFSLLVTGMLGVFALVSWIVAAAATTELAQRYAFELSREQARYLSFSGAEVMRRDPASGARGIAAMAQEGAKSASGAVFNADGRMLVRWGEANDRELARGLRTPIDDGHGKAGELWIAPPDASLATVLESGFGPILLVTFIVLAGCLIATRFALRGVTAPLRQLTDFAEQVSAQRMTTSRLDIRTGDELERLGQAFNQMMLRLEDSMRRIQHLAFVDPATNLPNLERLQRDLEAVAERTCSNDRCAALIVISFDQLRRHMDSVGRAEGEELLAAAAEKLSAALAAADPVVRLLDSSEQKAMLARVGGAEFAVLAPSISEDSEAERLVQLICAPFARPFEHRGARVPVGCFAGVAVLPKDGSDAESALRNARMALTAARGSAQPLRFFTPTLDRDAAERLTLEREIRQAIEANEFRAYFQPKVCLRTGRIIGAEALARWLRKDGVMIGPGRFIPLAEELGMIGPIAEAVLRDACWKASAWRREGMAATVAVNVSPIQLNDDRFPALVRRLLDESGLAPDGLELEITESVAMNDPERAIRLVEPLRNLGVRFAIDDFGTGHSSLAALTRLPFDVLKIDQSFVRSLSSDRQAVSIIETILALAASLDFEAVAEGVETEAEAEFLRRRGCLMAQGYHFGRPVPPLEFLAAIRAGGNPAAARSA